MMKDTKTKHASRATEESMHENDEHLQAERGSDAVPPADLGGHSKSHAAHPQGEAEHTKPAGNLRQGSHPGARREPPQGQGRAK